MISDYDLFVNKYISVPKDMGALNCAAFVAGIVKGVLDGAGFPARFCNTWLPLSCPAPAPSRFIACWKEKMQGKRSLTIITLLQGDSSLCASEGATQAQDYQY